MSTEKTGRTLGQFSLLSLLLLLTVAAIISSKIGADYREQQRDGSRIVPTVWDISSNQNILWRSPLGSSTWRAPVVTDDYVFIGTNNDRGQFESEKGDMGVLVCFDRETGQRVWHHANEKLPTGRVHDWPLQGITSRPAVLGDRLWYINNRAELVCLDVLGFRDGQNDGPYRREVVAESGEVDIVWKLDMMSELGVRPHNVSTCTVAVWEDRVFAVTGNGVNESHQAGVADAPSLIAVDKTTGKLIWSDNSPGQNVLHGQWGSPVVANLGGVNQVIYPGGDGWMYSLDPEGNGDGTSKVLWKFDCNPKKAQWILGGRGERSVVLHQPTIYKERLYFPIGQDPEHGEGQGRLWCIDPTKRGDVSAELVFNKMDPSTPIPHRRHQACIEEEGDFTKPNPNSAVIWQFTQQDMNGDGKIDYEDKMDRSLSTVSIKDDLGFVSDIAGVFHCFDVNTGRQHWSFDTYCSIYSSPIIAGKHVYLGNEDGDVLVFALSKDPKVATPGGKPVQVITCDTGINASVTVRSNVLYLATRNELFAIGKPAK